jgi:pimeloyl-ACP methyl ester carboxylesterase/predicted glycosyltransferase
MRARMPDVQGVVERNGVRIAYEVFGDGSPTVVLLPTWPIVHSRMWKAQVPYLCRHFRVVTIDGRGNGRSDRPSNAAAYADREFIADVVAVMDATATQQAVVVGASRGGRFALEFAAWRPDRTLGAVALAPRLPAEGEGNLHGDFDVVRETYVGWEKFNRHAWQRDYRDFVEFFMGQVFSEPHSTKQFEDAVSWGLETTPATLIATVESARYETGDEGTAIRTGVHAPVLVIHGDDDRVIAHADGELAAEWTGASLVTIAHGGHLPNAREPVRVNLILREFIESVAVRRPRRMIWTRARDRRKRALFASSPIGLGHVRRDMAIADELRARHPDLQIDWLTQHPATAVLEDAGERIHPASGWLANESKHLESECGEHDLHVFQAIRRMDEILVANFMVFHDLVAEEHFDLVIADEGWDIDHFLHENPELKRSPLAWLTDFVGWLPMPSGGPAEAALTADYNSEMVEHIARYPRLRDRSIFVGNPDDLVTDPLGPDLPTVRDWTMQHYDFAGYITGFDPAAVADVEGIRAELGWRPEDQVCLVSVGGSGVGTHLLKRVVDAYEDAARRVPGLRMVVITGPRIDPRSVPAPAGVELHGHVPGLYRHLSACDLAVVQGGLTTTMELVATRRPFLYFPLARHFEQQFHVPHRLARYGARPPTDYASTNPEHLAAAIAAQIGRPVDYRAVEADGAARAADLIADLV